MKRHLSVVEGCPSNKDHHSDQLRKQQRQRHQIHSVLLLYGQCNSDLISSSFIATPPNFWMIINAPNFLRDVHCSSLHTIKYVRSQYIRFRRKMFGKGRVVLLLTELLKDWPCTVSGGEIRTVSHGNN